MNLYLVIFLITILSLHNVVTFDLSDSDIYGSSDEWERFSTQQHNSNTPQLNNYINQYRMAMMATGIAQTSDNTNTPTPTTLSLTTLTPTTLSPTTLAPTCGANGAMCDLNNATYCCTGICVSITPGIYSTNAACGSETQTPTQTTQAATTYITTLPPTTIAPCLTPTITSINATQANRYYGYSQISVIGANFVGRPNYPVVDYIDSGNNTIAASVNTIAANGTSFIASFPSCTDGGYSIQSIQVDPGCGTPLTQPYARTMVNCATLAAKKFQVTDVHGRKITLHAHELADNNTTDNKISNVSPVAICESIDLTSGDRADCLDRASDIIDTLDDGVLRSYQLIHAVQSSLQIIDNIVQSQRQQEISSIDSDELVSLRDEAIEITSKTNEIITEIVLYGLNNKALVGDSMVSYQTNHTTLSAQLNSQTQLSQYRFVSSNDKQTHIQFPNKYSSKLSDKLGYIIVEQDNNVLAPVQQNALSQYISLSLFDGEAIFKHNKINRYNDELNKLSTPFSYAISHTTIDSHSTAVCTTYSSQYNAWFDNIHCTALPKKSTPVRTICQCNSLYFDILVITSNNQSYAFSRHNTLFSDAAIGLSGMSSPFDSDVVRHQYTPLIAVFVVLALYCISVVINQQHNNKYSNSMIHQRWYHQHIYAATIFGSADHMVALNTVLSSVLGMMALSSYMFYIMAQHQYNTANIINIVTLAVLSCAMLLPCRLAINQYTQHNNDNTGLVLCSSIWLCSVMCIIYCLTAITDTNVHINWLQSVLISILTDSVIVESLVTAVKYAYNNSN